jgi:hypothetical protein
MATASAIQPNQPTVKQKQSSALKQANNQRSARLHQARMTRLKTTTDIFTIMV